MIFFRRFAVHVVFDILILLIVPFVKKYFGNHYQIVMIALGKRSVLALRY